MNYSSTMDFKKYVFCSKWSWYHNRRQYLDRFNQFSLMSFHAKTNIIITMYHENRGWWIWIPAQDGLEELVKTHIIFGGCYLRRTIFHDGVEFQPWQKTKNCASIENRRGKSRETEAERSSIRDVHTKNSMPGCGGRWLMSTGHRPLVWSLGKRM